MNFKGQSEQSVINSSVDSSVISLLLPYLKGGITNPQIKVEIEENFEVIEFQLGHSIINLSESETQFVNPEKNVQYFYFILQGQVRILSFDSEKQRKVSIQLLSAGETFGADTLFESDPFSFEAIAASIIQVARIPLAHFAPWLDRFTELRDLCLSNVRQRQLLIFLKTLTPLRSLPSQSLQPMIPYFVEKRVLAGEILAQATPSTEGRFWLRTGQVENQALVTLGSSWGYPEDVPKDWRAETDLILYQFPKQAWESIKALTPRLETAFSSLPQSDLDFPSSAKNTRETSRFKVARRDLAMTSGHLSPIQSTPFVSLPTPPIQEPPVIDFPKPLKHSFRLWNRYSWMVQQSASDCGTTCLAMISQYWGRRLSLNFLRSLAGVRRSGASLKGLAKAAESLGYQARPVRASINRLIEQKNPWIAHWQGDHYVVVYQTRGNRFLIADPASGKRLLSRQEFLASWTGYALLLDPTERLKEMPEEKRSLSRFFGLLLPYRATGAQIIAASLLIQLFGVVVPLFTQIILDQVVVNKSLTTLNVFAIGLLLFGVWGIGLSAIRQYLLSYLANRLDLTMISGFIRHTLLLPLSFFETRHVGDILTRVSENEKIQRFLLGQVVLAWLDFFMGFIYLGLMLYYNWKLTLLVIALIPPFVLLTLAATPLLRKVSREVFNTTAEQNSALVETITGISTIKATATEQELRWRWEDRFTNSLNARFRSQKLGINLQAASGLINSLGNTALLWYGATLVIQDQLTIGQFVAFNMLIGKVLSPILSLINLWDELQEVLISVERLDDVFLVKPEEIPGSPLLVLPPLQGYIRFDNVTFRYDADEDHNTLQNISFEIQPGQTIAIVGRSGSGKSTLVKLLQALYQPNNGHIWIDGHDIRHVSPQSLRSQLGIVPQECYLFSGTILENITLYRPEFSLEQVIEVAKLAEAHPFIQGLPLGYNTKVGERGTNLSGGQRQRIAIARALLGEPMILILDEATSSLDTESERRFQANLTRISRERTALIIAHRLSTVHNADCIFVLDRGLLVEKGNHQDLMAQQGLYYYLAQQQLDL
jgi:ATP-binding cassette subfamily B protein